MATHAQSKSKYEPTDDQKRWDVIREVMGMMPLYSGYMLEKEGMEKPKSGLERLQTSRRHKCPYCNINAAGQHQDFCPDPNPVKQTGRPKGSASRAWPMACKKQGTSQSTV